MGSDQGSSEAGLPRPWWWRAGRATEVRLPVILLVLIAGTHYFYEILASAYQDQGAAARAIFYALRGIEGAALFVVIGLLARRPLVWLVCLWGAFEESQTAVCRLARGIDNVPGYEAFQGLCGNGWYTLGLMAMAGLAGHMLDKGDKNGVA
jgi:hypothetical protein